LERARINNDIYRELGARWYHASDDPVALLRAEATLRNPWIAQELGRRFGARPCDVLDVGCGGGFLANDLATRGHRVTGIDLSPESLAIAREHDETGTVNYREGDAAAPDFAPASFDCVCALDLLEHVESPEAVVAGAARMLRPGGIFFFHTFDRNWLSWLVVIKGVEWFVKNTPTNMHILRYFIKPSELRAMCERQGLEPVEIRGVRPRVDRAFFQMLRTRTVSPAFRFVFGRSLRVGYTGFARKASAVS
jgi:2-polyprenyl-6-hydroxyphenyl methylase / 3-demethylubiquinone-9 3-methyltransferase